MPKSADRITTSLRWPQAALPSAPRLLTRVSRAIGALFRAQLPIAPERRLVRERGVAIEHQLINLSGPQWTHRPDFAETARQFRRAIQVPGAAHSALEYYRWAVRAQIRTEGRRFVEAMGRRIEVPVLLLHGALDPCMLPATIHASTKWCDGPCDEVSMPGVGHYPHQEWPTATNDVLTKFLLT